MTDVKRERIAKMILATFRDVWCDRDTDDEPYFNCSKCEFEDGRNCRLKLFISNAKYEHAHSQGAITVSDESYKMVEGGEDE